MVKSEEEPLPNELLRYERVRLNLSQQEIVDKLKGHPTEQWEKVPSKEKKIKDIEIIPWEDGKVNINVRTVRRWETGEYIPSPYYLRRLVKIFNRTAQELGYPPEGAHPRIPFWYVPHNQPSQTEFFMSREDYLLRLHSVVVLRNKQYGSDEKMSGAKTEHIVLQPQALVGLGGIGKTQIAIEYAYRYANEYQTVIWLRASSYEVLEADFANLATILNWPQKDLEDQLRIKAVKDWLMHFTRWLLIFDDAEDVEVIRDFLPPKCFGHIIVTTRSAATGKLAQAIEVGKIPLGEAASFLLRRSKVIEPETLGTDAIEEKFALAREIARLFDGLPLMLEQAGAYIETTGCGIAGYLADYNAQGALLRQKPKLPMKEYPHTVATAWQMSFDKVRQVNPIATDLLSLFAFLPPDAIFEEMLTKAASTLGTVLSVLADDPSALNDAMVVLRHYSLVKRHEETKTCSIHSLVQTVIWDGMNEEERRMWAERCICALKQIHMQYLDSRSFNEKYQEHALLCTIMIRRLAIKTVEAGWLLGKVGTLNINSGRYEVAEKFLKDAVEIWRQLPDLSRNKSALEDMLVTILNIGWVYHMRNDFESAEWYFKAVINQSQDFELSQSIRAMALNGYAEVLRLWRKDLRQAEQLHLQALEIYTKAGNLNDKVAFTLNSLSFVYQDAGDYHRALPLLIQALKLTINIFGAFSREVAACLSTQVYVCRALSLNREEMRCHEQLMRMRQTVLRPDDPLYIKTLVSLAEYYRKNGRPRAAEVVLRRAMGAMANMPQEYTIWEGIFNELSLTLIALHMFEEAEAAVSYLLHLYANGLLGITDPQYINYLSRMATLCAVQGKFKEAYYSQLASFDRLCLQTNTIDHVVQPLEPNFSIFDVDKIKKSFAKIDEIRNFPLAQ